MTLGSRGPKSPPKLILALPLHYHRLDVFNCNPKSFSSSSELPNLPVHDGWIIVKYTTLVAISDEQSAEAKFFFC